MKRTFASSAALTGVLILWGAPNALAAQDGACSNATLKGAYGFFTGATILPDETPRGTIGRWDFDGLGHFTANLTINDNGTVIHVTDAGTYTVGLD
jgi:spore coat protein U-like protein